MNRTVVVLKTTIIPVPIHSLTSMASYTEFRKCRLHVYIHIDTLLGALLNVQTSLTEFNRT